ncbi:hypothetical protein [Streptomyces sp. NPDC059009]|uniref:hypothetical protein n=1 Tax=Streptomyces sp. NPDC059009 TaxID=3346694 RepID=UPI0036CA92EA
MFAFSLVKPTRGLPDGFVPDELEDTQDYEYLAMYACSLLAETDCAFHLGGFGQDDWAFNVESDMSSFVEELPTLIAGMERGQVVEVPLYTQGIERNLVFTPVGERVSIRCESSTDWIPSPEEEEMTRDQLMSMMRDLARDFSEALAMVAPQVAQLSLFPKWRSGC